MQTPARLGNPVWKEQLEEVRNCCTVCVPLEQADCLHLTARDMPPQDATAAGTQEELPEDLILCERIRRPELTGWSGHLGLSPPPLIVRNPTQQKGDLMWVS